jgi:hypothetical protein
LPFDLTIRRLPFIVFRSNSAVSTDTDEMIPVDFDKLIFSNMGFVILLKGKSDKRTLPIFIGTVEAQSIALFISNVKIPRPLTHDLLKDVIEHLSCRIERIEVCDLRVFTEAEISSESENEAREGQLNSLKQDLDKAVTEERYEDAAKIRDEIKRLENMHTEN